MKTKEFPILFGLSSTGKPKQWKVRVIDNGIPAIEISHGYVDGKIVVSEKQIKAFRDVRLNTEQGQMAYQADQLFAEGLITADERDAMKAFPM